MICAHWLSVERWDQCLWFLFFSTQQSFETKRRLGKKSGKQFCFFFLFGWTTYFYYEEKNSKQRKHSKKKRYYMAESKLAFTLITLRKQVGQFVTSKELTTLLRRDHLARVWVAIFAFLETQQNVGLGRGSSAAIVSWVIVLILHRTSWQCLETMLRQIRQSPSKVIADEFIWPVRDIDHFNASASVWRGELVFALFEQLISSPLYSV